MSFVENGSVISPDVSMYDGERPEFFRQLSLAGLITGNYDGSDVLGAGYPVSAVNNGGGIFATGPWDTWDNSNEAIDDSSDIITDNLYLSIIVCDPSEVNVSSGFNDRCGIFTAEQAWNIETKIDDGIPQSGSIIAHAWDVTPECTVNTRDAYNLSAGNSPVCNLIISLE